MLYDAAKGGNLLGTATVASGATSATVSISQIGSTAGSVYVSLTDSNKLESDRTEADYIAEAASDSLDASNISVTNRSGSADTVSITGASQNDVINVYDLAQGGTLLGTATVAASETKASISITQLGTDRGSIYVSRTSSNKSESTRVKVDYDAEPNSTAPSASNIIVTNNAGINDTVEVKGLSVGDLVQIYDSATGDTVLGSATVESNATEATVSIAQLGTATVASSAMEGTVTISQLGSSAGTVYVSVTRSGYTESSRTAVAYSAESTAPVAGNISVVNNAVISDTITVKGLTSNDIVKVYDASTSGNLIGYAIVAANSDEATVTVSQLTTGAGSVYVSVTNFGKGESKRTKADYIAEQTSAALYAGNVNIVNNPSGTSDVITVSNLSGSDVIKVYDAATGGNLIGTATVSANGTQATITISQLSTAAGSVYISVTNLGKNESNRTEVSYVAEN